MKRFFIVWIVTTFSGQAFPQEAEQPVFTPDQQAEVARVMQERRIALREWLASGEQGLPPVPDGPFPQLRFPLLGTEELEIIFENDSVDPVWGAEMEGRLWRVISDSELEFRRVDINCKRSICRVESEIRYHFLESDRSDAYREIQRTGFRAAIAQDDRLDLVYGDTEQPAAIHFLYASEIDPVLQEMRAYMRAVN